MRSLVASKTPPRGPGRGKEGLCQQPDKVSPIGRREEVGLCWTRPFSSQSSPRGLGWGFEAHCVASPDGTATGVLLTR